VVDRLNRQAVRREQTTDVSMLERLVAPDGKDVLDIGCGGGALVRELACRGARAIGLEVSQQQLGPALARDPDGRARYLVGRAQALPLPDASVDVAVFMPWSMMSSRSVRRPRPLSPPPARPASIALPPSTTTSACPSPAWPACGPAW
jgi:SAM-dependent methyltransferase